MKKKKPEPRSVLAIDPGTQIVGWAYFCDGQRMDSGIIESGEQYIGRRLLWIDTVLRSIFEMKLPEAVVMEDCPQVRGNSRKTYYALGGGAGLVHKNCAAFRLKAHILTPAQWKSAFCGKGNASKPEVRAVVEAQYGITVESEDESDAIGIGAAWLAMEGTK